MDHNKTGNDRKSFEFYEDIDEFLSGSDKVNPQFVKESNAMAKATWKNFETNLTNCYLDEDMGTDED